MYVLPAGSLVSRLHPYIPYISRNTFIIILLLKNDPQNESISCRYPPKGTVPALRYLLGRSIPVFSAFLKCVYIPVMVTIVPPMTSEMSVPVSFPKDVFNPKKKITFHEIGY